MAGLIGSYIATVANVKFDSCMCLIMLDAVCGNPFTQRSKGLMLLPERFASGVGLFAGGEPVPAAGGAAAGRAAAFPPAADTTRLRGRAPAPVGSLACFGRLCMGTPLRHLLTSHHLHLFLSVQKEKVRFNQMSTPESHNGFLLQQALCYLHRFVG